MPIADIFYDRNDGAFVFTRHDSHQRAFHQIGTMIFERAFPLVHNVENTCENCYTTLCREIGVEEIMDRHTGTYYERHLISYRDACKEFIGNVPNLALAHSCPAPKLLSIRLSLAELILRNVDNKARRGNRSDDFDLVLGELNERLKRLDFPFRYHGGVFQPAQDDLSEVELDTPFWSLVAAPVWKNVDDEMKDAFDARANNRDDAVFNASKALESTIKIISEKKGWSRGNEKGAANYVDNLVSAANGRFVETWEGEMLKAFFRDVRNPMGHGSGSGNRPNLNAHQTDWAIDFCIGWIKNLVRRSGI
ncbi:MAG: hypothetical protein KJ904_00330 [Alphaproteobacteria bacterium]|nr:hypothetical protein [Alphaproteobacteria bacterium]MBU0799079.1 hypothetical protein [Alphaproteobacteria bacterium]MBU0885589.1 hypothetical protein [Alphaproteobacteria bacterium]MBU1813756.1 hypothetical protein [Alphaproteobacteria bacterium]MBU2091431.1 hypothetical protein [Alphaproteobacteria bacterium]